MQPDAGHEIFSKNTPYNLQANSQKVTMKMGNKLLTALVLSYFSITAFAANPLNTTNYYLNEPESGDGPGSGMILALCILYFAIAFWLLVSAHSPIQRWVEKNKGLAAFYFLALGPVILSLLAGAFQ